MTRTFLFFAIFAFAIGTVFSQNNSSIEVAKRSLVSAQKDTAKARLMAELTLQYRNSTNLDSSLKYGHLALGLSRKIHFYKAEVVALRELGFTYRVLGEIPKALHLAETKGYQLEIAWCLNALGVIFNAEIQDPHKALIYLRRALQLYQSNKFSPRDEFVGTLEVNLYVNVAAALKNNHQLDSALLFYKKATKMSFNGLAQIRIAEIEFELGHSQIAEYYFRVAREWAKQGNANRGTCDVYYALANHFKVVQQLDSSRYYGKKSLELAQLLNYKRRVLNAGNLLAEEYESIDVNQALYYRKIAAQANDALYGPSKVQSLLRTISDEQEHQQKIEKDRIAYENRVKQYFLFTGLFILLLIGGFLYRNNQLEKKSKRQLQEKNKVIEQTLVNLKSTQAQLIQSEKLASLGELTAGIAHEIQNPLNFVNNFSELNRELITEMKEELVKGNIEEGIAIAGDLETNEERINHHGQRASAIVKGMLEHSRTSTGVKESTDLNALADEYLRLAYHGLRAKDDHFNATMETHFDQDLPLVSVIPQDIGRVLLNLINNAFYAVTEKAKQGIEGYQPSVTINSRKLENAIEISVKDNGNGIPDAIHEKIFQPFFTTKPTGQGTGLGLSLAYDIVTKGHGGSLEMDSQPGKGSSFTMVLPIEGHV
ncbi:MAG TPA: ATP-binding protein [Haliscomenobacter sp.]|uniref:tetratricopeptide repeat-containing sensor histidine kinase n=1 Tax=Haliscomenobacter sp. TaxID=2717303 RepID=UPI002BECB3BF|nr:ATP-binding protein [Haliscomenobacter sp.]HOY16668.1 ATP-binding protein [Haliscomenobacter sp.]